MTTTFDSSESGEILDAVRDRYGRGAEARVPELCCPVDYDASLLEVLPDEIVERDYGCGDPSRFVQRGDRVLDLGSGAGKICFMASQLVGPEGSVVGVDATPEMLALARKHQRSIGERIGHHNVRFHRGQIEDLRLDHERVEAFLERHPVHDLAGLEALRAEERRLRREEPMVADASVDVVVSNCVLNLVAGDQKQRLFREIARVLDHGGRCAISDIVSDEDVPLELQRDPELWSGCISGALREDRLLQSFVDAGLHGVASAAYQAEPWAVVRGIEFRSLTVVAHKSLDRPRKDHNEALIYGGPFERVRDDRGREFVRGERTAVDHATFERLRTGPYAGLFTPVAPLVPVAANEAPDYSCCRDRLRSPSETKRGTQRADVAPGTGSAGSSCC
jgi:SAM-dependent methyltransferase